MSIKTVSSAEFCTLHHPALPMVDVRSPAEFDTVHVEGALSCPLTELDVKTLVADLHRRAFGAGDTLYLLCHGGRRAQMAAEKIAAEFPAMNLVVVQGGTEACIAAGVAIRRGGRRTISLERQVRIVAGLLVLTGVLLGTILNPAWYGLSGFVGAGLTFAGVTDTCLMGMLLLRMPWNRA